MKHVVLTTLFVLWVAAPLLFAVPGDVIVVDTGSEVTLSNDIVSGKFEKTSPSWIGCMTSLKKNSVELMGNGGAGYFDADWSGGYLNPLTDATYYLVRSDPNYAEIKFRHEANLTYPFSVELHYVLHRGDSGFYVYATYEYDSELYLQACLLQTRYVLRMDSAIFDYIAVDEDRQREMPTPQELADGELLYGSVIRLPDGTYWDKYWNSVCERSHHVHGLTGENGPDKYGIWVISASNEYLNGGPTKQNLTVHQTPDGPVVLRMFQGSHYGFSVLVFTDENWQHIYGPFFIYVNSGPDRATLWSDAKNQADMEKSQWPYTWMNHSLYPVNRGTVTGQLNITDGSSPEGACVLLAAASQNWQQQGKEYMFWADTDANGSFIISDVRAGDYTLYAYVPGVLDEFCYDEVNVPSGGTTDLGDLIWTPAKLGELLWQIGVPDRTAAEYKWGDDYRQAYLWTEYPNDFPNDVNFVIGETYESNDWNYVQQPVDLGGGPLYLPPWDIKFDMPADIPADEAVLTIAIASAAYGAGLKVSVNGAEIADFPTLFPYDGTNVGAGIFGHYRVKNVSFDTSLLHEGRNTITLLQTHNYEFAGIMYDCLRLEIRASADINLDMHVDMLDFVLLATSWLDCTEPEDVGCHDLQ